MQLPKAMLKAIPKEYFDGARGTLKLLWEVEWRALGITQSLGWEHYEVHEPEPHILLFKWVFSLNISIMRMLFFDSVALGLSSCHVFSVLSLVIGLCVAYADSTTVRQTTD